MNQTRQLFSQAESLSLIKLFEQQVAQEILITTLAEIFIPFFLSPQSWAMIAWPRAKQVGWVEMEWSS